MRKIRSLLGLVLVLGGLALGACREPSGVEREVHPENWLFIHGEKVQNSGTFSCNQCHPPEGDWPGAPTCSSCHGERR